MAEIVLRFAIPEILKRVVSLEAQEFSLAWGFKGEITKLRESFEMIQAVLRDAEQRQVREEAVNLWLKKLKGVAYDADDVLDELAYEVLRRKVKLHNRIEKKVINFLSPSNNPIAFRLKMAHKVKNINLLLDKIKNEASGFALSLTSIETTPQFSHSRETDSFADDSKIVGRESTISKIVEILTNSGDQEVLSVIPIVGMGGIGKTTIAQSVYRHDEIERHFDAKIWVCVSENFDAKRILRECLESLLPGKAPMENMNAIVENLQKELQGKRYLLVLDDVWNKELEKWGSLKNRLLQINTTKGNNIIVTTRSDEVASIMETISRHLLGELSEEDCWSIFKDRAFANGGAPMTSDLEGIGREIVKKCSGVPLAAKVLGGMMHSKKKRNEWLSIQNSEIWDLLEDQNGILPALKLSFNNLPSPSLKQCFAYCSVFPKDFNIAKDNLVQLWMAQGFLQPPQGSHLEMEDLGDGYFNILLANSLFLDATKDKYDNITSCKMHDLVHDLAQYVSRFESLNLESNTVNDRLEIRHLSLIPNEKILPTIPRQSVRKVRTLSSISEANFCMLSSLNMLSNFRGLRVLNLSGAHFDELPNSIGKLKHLRYLDVSQTRIKVFPKSISKLYNLQTLRMIGCSSLSQIPNELKNLISLRHLCIVHYYHYTNKQMPIAMGQLTCLQTLEFFVVGQERGRRIEELGYLNKLKGKFRIHGLEHVRDGEESKKANLMAKTNIDGLVFEWISRREGNNNNDENVLEGLQPHLNLKTLEIKNFWGDKFPPWVMGMKVNTNGSGSLSPLKNLVEIVLDNCKKCEQIPMLGHLPCLMDLTIDHLDNVKCIGAEFYGYNHNVGNERGAFFPALKRLNLWWMRNLVEWMEAKGTPAARVVFPCLEKLHILGCPELTTVPSHFSSPRELWITDVKLSFLPDALLQNNKNLADLSIRKCPELTYIPLHVSGFCSSLQSLSIFGCPKLSYLSDALHTFTSLEDLRIVNCPNLENVPSLYGLTSLCKLEIKGCDGLTSLPSGLQSCTSLEDLTVRHCPNLISVPEYIPELPSLSSLGIGHYGNLKCMPEWLHCLTNLKALGIGGFWEELNSFPNFEDILKLHVASLRELTLWGWPKINSLPDQLQHLTALKCLSISGFDGLEALPEELGSLSSLENLTVERCKILMYLPALESIQRLTKLRKLEVHDCPLLQERCSNGSGPEWSKIDHILAIGAQYSSSQGWKTFEN